MSGLLFGGGFGVHFRVGFALTSAAHSSFFHGLLFVCSNGGTWIRVDPCGADGVTARYYPLPKGGPIGAHEPHVVHMHSPAGPMPIFGMKPEKMIV